VGIFGLWDLSQFSHLRPFKTSNRIRRRIGFPLRCPQLFISSFKAGKMRNREFNLKWTGHTTMQIHVYVKVCRIIRIWNIMLYLCICTIYSLSTVSIIKHAMASFLTVFHAICYVVVALTNFHRVAIFLQI